LTFILVINKGRSMLLKCENLLPLKYIFIYFLQIKHILIFFVSVGQTLDIFKYIFIIFFHFILFRLFGKKGKE